MCAVLRAYGHLRCDDVGEDDWFTFYYDCVRSKTEVMYSMMRQALNKEGGQFEALLYKLWDPHMEKIKEFAAHAPSKERIPRIRDHSQ